MGPRAMDNSLDMPGKGSTSEVMGELVLGGYSLRSYSLGRRSARIPALAGMRVLDFQHSAPVPASQWKRGATGFTRALSPPQSVPRFLVSLAVKDQAGFPNFGAEVYGRRWRKPVGACPLDDQKVYEQSQ